MTALPTRGRARAAPMLVAAVVVLAILAGAALAAWIAPGLALHRAERAASRALGRPVTIGALHLLPMWPPTLVAERVRVEAMGTVERVRAGLDPAALGAGRGRVGTVELVRPDIAIVTDPTGLASPRLSRPALSAPSVTAPSKALPRAAARVTLPDVTVRDARITWRDPRLPGPLVLHADGSLVGGAARLDVSGLYRALPFTAAVAVPSLDALRAGAGPVRLDLRAGAATLAAAGTLHREPGPNQESRAFDGHLALRAPDAAALAALAPTPFAAPLAPSGPIALDADISLSPWELAVRGAGLQAPFATLRTDATLSLPQGRPPSLRADVQAEAIDADALSHWIAAIARAQPARVLPAPQPPAVPLPSALPTPRLIPDKALPWALLARLEADVALRAGRLRVGGADYADAAVTLALHGGALTAAPLAVTAPGGARVQGEIALDGRATPPHASVLLHAPAIGIAPLLQALHQPPYAEGQAALSVNLRAAGLRARALAASLDGELALHMGSGKVANRLLDVVFTAIGVPLPRLPGDMTVRCLDIDLRATQGLVDVASMALDTNRVRIDGEGDISLADESLDVTLHPLWRGGFGFSVPLDLRGTLARPDLGMGGMLAALLPPPSPACPDQPELQAGQPEPAKPKLPRLKDLLRQLR